MDFFLVIVMHYNARIYGGNTVSFTFPEYVLVKIYFNKMFSSSVIGRTALLQSLLARTTEHFAEMISYMRVYQVYRLYILYL